MKHLRALPLLFLAACNDAPAPAAPRAIELLAPAEVQEGERFEVECRTSGAGDERIEYLWSHLGVQPRLELAPNGGAKQTLVAPEWFADVDLVLEVQVTSAKLNGTARRTVRLRAPDDAPVAEIAAASACECGEMISLTGQAQNERMQEVSATWRQIGDGPRIAIDGSERLQALFLTPEHDGPYGIDVELTVRDAGGGEGKARHHIDVTCDPASVPLPAGQELELLARTGTSSELPRGKWMVSGTLELSPTGDGSSEALLRFDAGKSTGAGLKLVRAGDELQMMTTTLAASPEGVWFEPEFKRVMPLGPWPAQVPFGFEFESDGREVQLRFGPAGARESWPQLPFEIFLLLDRRPRAFAIDVLGAEAKLGRLTLLGK